MQYWQIWHLLKRNVQNAQKEFKIIKTWSITIMHFANTSQALMAQLAESTGWLSLVTFM